MVELFISYSHKDDELRNELDIHLSSLKRLKLISVWHDRRITGGENIDFEISEHLLSSNIIILLVSPDFIASNYCYDVELKTAINKHESGSATVLPVILRPCDWHDLPFGKLMATPPDGKPIIKYHTLDDGFLEVVMEIKKIIKSKNLSSNSQTNKISISQTPSHKLEERSSNLRIKQNFTDEDHDKFELDTFEYLYRFFENSLIELTKRNLSTTYRLRRIDFNNFESVIYIDGTEKAACVISVSTDKYFSNGITFSYGRNRQGHNESLNVENDGYIQYLRPMGMGLSMMGSNSSEKLTMEGAAEYYWDLFIKNLQ